MGVEPYSLRIRQVGSSLVHVARRTGIDAETPCGYRPGAGHYTVVAAEPVSCPDCVRHAEDRLAEAPGGR